MVFNEVKHYLKQDYTKNLSIKERASVAKRHLEMSVAWKGEKLGVYETRRHYSNYFKSRILNHTTKTCSTETSNEVYKILDSISEKFAQYLFNKRNNG